MTLDEAKAYLGPAYVFYGHGKHQWKDYPQHSSYALVDVRATVERVKRQRQESFSSAVEQHKQKLRLVYGRVAA